jgi:uncharacterized membrane protein
MVQVIVSLLYRLTRHQLTVPAVLVRQNTHTHWRINVAGVHREFDATITEQHPDERVAWRSDDGPVTPERSCSHERGLADRFRRP